MQPSVTADAMENARVCFLFVYEGGPRGENSRGDIYLRAMYVSLVIGVCVCTTVAPISSTNLVRCVSLYFSGFSLSLFLSFSTRLARRK